MKFLIGYICGIVSVGINYLIFTSENNCHIKVLQYAFRKPIFERDIKGTENKEKTMFKKEAKERARKLEESQTLGVYDSDEDYARDSGWNDGEVAGYEEGFKDGAEFGYNKANEWHDLRKDPTDLPKDNDEKLCFYGKGKVVARYCSEYGCWETEFNNLVTTFSSSILIAWREIVFPKEIEEK